jgi:ABC-type multidrug transport system ATPase subunit
MNKTPQILLSAEGLTKEFKGVDALNSVSLLVNANEVVGIIGPNGSGKTTLLNIICGFIKPNAGSIYLGDHRMAMSISRRGFFSQMSVQKNLEMYAQLIGTSKEQLDKVVQDFEIDYTSKHFGKLSAGMQQKVSLVFAFMTDARLILLDEPLNHLDVNSIIKLRELIQKRKQEGTSFLISSHILSDLEKVCDRIYFFRKGKVFYSGVVKELLLTFGTLENAYIKIS